MLEAVFFDVGNTLVHPHPSVSHVCREVLAAAGHERDLSAIEGLMPDVDAYYERHYREDDTFWRSEEQTAEVWVGMYSMLYRRLGLEADARDLARRVYDEFGDPSRWRAYGDVEPAFRRLRDRGLKVGVISNWDSRLASLLDGIGLGTLLETVVSSADVGLHKPDPRIFELACQRVGVKPARAAHVGDHHYADIVGAESAGLCAVLIDRHGGQNGSIADFDRLEAALGLEDA